MSDGDVLMSAILAEPDEDVPRLAFADWLDEHGGESERARADLIRVQIELAHLPPQDLLPWRRRLVALRARENRLFMYWRERWLAPLKDEGGPLAGAEAHAEFRRGFVDVVWMPAGWFAARAERLFTPAPVTELRVTRATVAEVAAVARCPQFRQLSAFDVCDARLGDDVARILARCPARLRTLRLRGCGLTDIAAFWLADVEFDWPIAELDVQHNPLLSAAGLAALRERFGADTVLASRPVA
jgi:uncharacterized protein (TIGR02996 family)